MSDTKHDTAQRAQCAGCGEHFHEGDDVYWNKSGDNLPFCDGCVDAEDRAWQYDKGNTEDLAKAEPK